MTPLAGTRHAPVRAVLWAAFVAGAASVVGQVGLLRDLLTLFSGFEPAAGLAIASWLLWTGLGARLAAGRFAARPGRAASALAWLMCAWAVSMPVTIMSVRAVRPAFGVALGVMPGLTVLAATALAAPAAMCLAGGAVLSAGFAALAELPGQSRPIRVYAAEAAGSAAGGLVLFFAVIPAMPVFAGVIATALCLALYACWCAARFVPKRRLGLALVLGAALCFLAAGIALSGRLERVSRIWQWGPDLLASVDSPYQNLAVTSRDGQLSFFGSGSWLFTAGDRQSLELAAHLPMLMRPGVRDVLVLGGDVYGLTTEIFKYPGVARVTAVEPDPRILSLAATLLPTQTARLALDPRFAAREADAAAFVRAHPGFCDLILMQAPEPVSAQANRFYTAEFFAAAKKALKPGGLLAFSLPSSPEGASAAKGRMLAVVRSTLASVFANVLVVPGDMARFFAADSLDLVADTAVIEARRASLCIDTVYARDYYLIDLLNPFQIERFAGILVSAAKGRINRDFTPACYLDGLVLASASVHPGLGRAFLALSGLSRTEVRLACLALALVLAASGRKRGLRAAAASATGCAGFCAMGLELGILIAYQVLEGSLYEGLALLVAAYMGGLGLGAALGETGRIGALSTARLPLVLGIVQSVLAAAAMAVPLLGRAAAAMADAAGSGPAVPFALAAALCGAVAGLHFCLAARLAAGGEGVALPAGRLYASDMAGAGAGSLVCGFILVPVLGLGPACEAAGLVCLAGVAALLAAAVTDRPVRVGA